MHNSSKAAGPAAPAPKPRANPKAKAKAKAYPPAGAAIRSKRIQFKDDPDEAVMYGFGPTDGRDNGP